MRLFPQYVTDALTKQAGRCPKVRVMVGRYPSDTGRALAGEFGIIYVFEDEAADDGVGTTLDSVWSRPGWG